MKKLLTVTLFSGVLTLLRMGSGFLISKAVAIYAGPSGIAMLGQVQSVVAAITGIVTAPVGSGTVRFTAENHHKGFSACAPWWGASLRWLICITAIVVPMTVILSGYLSLWTLGDRSYSWVLIVAAVALPLAGANTLFASVINGQQLYRRFVGLGIVSVLLSTCLTLFLISRFGRDGALLSAAISAGVAGVIMTLGIWREPWFKLKYWLGKTDSVAMRAIGGYVAMAVCSSICAAASLILVRNILVAELGWTQTGYWQAVYKISEVYLGVLTIALSTYYLPRLSKITGREQIRSEILQTSKVIIPIVAVLAITVYFLRDFVISVLFTAQFKPARDLFAIQLAGDVIKMASWLFAYPMLSTGATKVFVTTEIVFSVIFVGLTFIMVRIVGLQGATWAFTINYLLYFFVVAFFLPFGKSSVEEQRKD